MSATLRAFRPEEDLSSDSNGFRCDTATVARVVDWWEQNPARVATSQVAEVERRRIWNLLRLAMGAKLVLECRPFHLDAFIRSQPSVKANATRRRWNTTVQQAFNEAELQGLIIKNPFRGLKYEAGKRGRDWTDDELRAVLENASKPFAELVIGMRLSSLRPKEACELCWYNVRFEHTDIKIIEHKSRRRTDAPACIPMNQPLIALLVDIRSRRNPGARVFLTPKRVPWTRDHADATFRHLREAIGLPADLKLHGCRHTFATGAIMNDVGVMHLQQIMRHADVRTTQRYVHLAGDTKRLIPAMNKAVEGVEIAGPKTVDDTPLFDGLE